MRLLHYRSARFPKNVKWQLPSRKIIPRICERWWRARKFCSDNLHFLSLSDYRRDECGKILFVIGIDAHHTINFIFDHHNSKCSRLMANYSALSTVIDKLSATTSLRKYHMGCKSQKTVQVLTICSLL